MVPVAWDNVVWGLPATTCFPELWAARSICFNHAFSIPRIWFSFISFSKQQMGFLSLCAAPSYLMSPPLLAQGPPMRADSSSHPIGIFIPTLQPPQSSWVQRAGCAAWGWAGAVDSTPTALGGNLRDAHIFPLLLGKQAAAPALLLASCDWISQPVWRLLSVLQISSLSPSSHKSKMSQFGVSFFSAMSLQKLFSFSWQWLRPREIKQYK